jgi:hypothetical protein
LTIFKFEKKRREEDRKYENEKWVDDQRKNIIDKQFFIVQKNVFSD